MRHPFAMKDGDKIAILRPDDWRLALRMAQEALQVEDDDARKEAFDAILRAQPYSFVGLMAMVGKPDRKLLNENGWAVGSCKPGDSMVPYSQIQQASEKAKAAESKSAIEPSAIKLGDGTAQFRLERRADGTYGSLTPDTEEIVVEPVVGGDSEKMTVGTWRAKCVCGGGVSAIYDDGDGKPNGLIHTDPPCRDFVEKDALDFVVWLNQKIREGVS